MNLVSSDMIGKIDEYASFIGIPTEALMHRAGKALEAAVRLKKEKGKKVLILAGGGNNGGDGYALAYLINSDYSVTVVDVFDKGQRSEAGKYHYKKYLDNGGKKISGSQFSPFDYSDTDVIVDAIFGTGFSGDYPEELKRYVEFIRNSSALKIAVDVPLGVKSDTGEVVSEFLYTADLTVCLSYVKAGLMSYPAKAYVGELLNDNLSLPKELIESEFSFDSFALDRDLVKELLPNRDLDSHKGSFGKLLMICGSDAYRGAAHLSLEAALRGGAGLVYFLGESELCFELRLKYPEAVYIANEKRSTDELQSALSYANRSDAVLIGSGSGRSEWLYRLIIALLRSDGCPLILDADAINLLSENREESLTALRHSSRKVVLTPHPLEFARISGLEVSAVQGARLDVAKRFAEDNCCTVVLKGASTVVTDGRKTYINTTGSSALAKGGSGDVLAGFVASLSAFSDPLCASGAAVYLHGLAADTLSETLSEFSVTPSDLPKEIGRQIKSLTAL